VILTSKPQNQVSNAPRTPRTYRKQFRTNAWQQTTQFQQSMAKGMLKSNMHDFYISFHLTQFIHNPREGILSIELTSHCYNNQSQLQSQFPSCPQTLAYASLILKLPSLFIVAPCLLDTKVHVDSPILIHFGS